MQKTTNLNLNKPETTDFYDVDDFNENADILDSAINTINTTLNGLSTVATSGSYNDLTDKPDAYTLPKASTTTLGGIKVGDNLSIDSNGVLSADGDATIILETEAEYEALSEAEKLAGTYLIKESNEETIGASVIPYDSSVSVKTKIDAIDTKLNNNLIESDSFNSSHTYSIGDMFNCDGKLYKVKVACSGVTPPNSTYYDEYTLTSELSALNNSLTQNVTYDATTGFYYMVVMGNLLVMWKQALISTGQGYLKQDNFTLPKAYGDVNAMCIQVTKKGVGTSEALDRATPYVAISDTTHIIVGLEDGHAGLSSTEGQFVMITIVGYSA